MSGDSSPPASVCIAVIVVTCLVCFVMAGNWGALLVLAVPAMLACIVFGLHLHADRLQADAEAAAGKPRIKGWPPSGPVALAFAKENLLWKEDVVASGLDVPILLHYRDNKGDVSERIVRVSSVGGRRTRAGYVYLSSIAGYCMVRQAPRSFKTSQALGFLNHQTGEEITDLGLFLLGEPDTILGHPQDVIRPAALAKRPRKLQRKTAKGPLLLSGSGAATDTNAAKNPAIET